MGLPLRKVPGASCPRAPFHLQAPGGLAGGPEGSAAAAAPLPAPESAPRAAGRSHGGAARTAASCPSVPGARVRRRSPAELPGPQASLLRRGGSIGEHLSPGQVRFLGAGADPRAGEADTLSSSGRSSSRGVRARGAPGARMARRGRPTQPRLPLTTGTCCPSCC